MSTFSKILVCGGRDFEDRDLLFETLSKLKAERPFSYLIQGGARGADSLACLWAQHHNVVSLQFDADWTTHGRSAGPIRNARMLEEGPQVVVAFPGGGGSENMVAQAKARGVEVIRVEQPPESRAAHEASKIARGLEFAKIKGV